MEKALLAVSQTGILPNIMPIMFYHAWPGLNACLIISNWDMRKPIRTIVLVCEKTMEKTVSALKLEVRRLVDNGAGREGAGHFNREQHNEQRNVKLFKMRIKVEELFRDTRCAYWIQCYRKSESKPAEYWGYYC
jgi:hypothetical protein